MIFKRLYQNPLASHVSKQLNSPIATAGGNERSIMRFKESNVEYVRRVRSCLEGTSLSFGINNPQDTVLVSSNEESCILPYSDDLTLINYFVFSRRQLLNVDVQGSFAIALQVPEYNSAVC
jgi:hypothetical protein